MTASKRPTWQVRATALACCLLFSSMLWAQSGGNANPQSSSEAQSKTAPAQTAAPAPSAKAEADDTYVIGPSDVLAINVWKEPEISRAIPVRSDGRISLPLIGEVEAAGHTPHQLQQEIARKLQSFISEPDVTVIVQEIRSQKFNVLGQVARPGSYLLTDSTTVLDAIALAGGFRDFAKQRSIYVLRKGADGSQSRLPFNYKDVVKGKNIEQNIKLLPHDTVVVP